MGNIRDRPRRNGQTRREAQAECHAGKAAGPLLCGGRRCPVRWPALPAGARPGPSGRGLLPPSSGGFSGPTPPTEVVYQKCSELENRDFGRQLARKERDRAPGPFRMPADEAGVGWRSMPIGTTASSPESTSSFALPRADVSRELYDACRRVYGAPSIHDACRCRVGRLAETSETPPKRIAGCVASISTYGRSPAAGSKIPVSNRL